MIGLRVRLVDIPILNPYFKSLRISKIKIILLLIRNISCVNNNDEGSFQLMVCRIVGESFRVIMENEEEVEISFTSKWDPSLEGERAPLNIDKR